MVTLAAVRPDGLAALVVGETVRRAGIPAEAVDEVVLGAAGPQEHARVLEAAPASAFAIVRDEHNPLVGGTARAAAACAGGRRGRLRSARGWGSRSVPTCGSREPAPGSRPRSPGSAWPPTAV
ncbi:hypothetical protein SGFS_006410 [Streptomyces graminofaciens]|uniref:Uncharacterized protein n=1 Tax=Streptomyces graminofaciens TaxID=68212 RepID=A0ABM9SBM7_9ACTN|nr:hypothetical protein SGFS_006410 [Streptomyces graminofaciens]